MTPGQEQTTVALQSQVAEHEVRLHVHTDSLEKHEKWIIQIMNRPPIWATFVITGLTGIVCACAGAILTRMF
ncbi:hypothetical protein LCGC14_2120620 [marine sediment metagenome]|uniref:Uncharacterized protein n=1 Tax=marine sediment metagenome TaxID=412755 RepID=A0A0F9E4E3_9ZZZZ